MRRRSSWIWGGRVAAAMVAAGFVAYLSSVGLDKADQLASVLGLLVAAAALVAPYLLPSPDGDHSGSGSGQQVENAVVSGHLTQLRDAKGMRVHGPVAAGPPPPAPINVGPFQGERTGQSVNGVWVGGNLTQIDGADGDISIG